MSGSAEFGLSIIFANMRFFTAVFALVISVASVSAQSKNYTHADTLKGSITRERAWWDVTRYELSVRFNLQDSTIAGSNRIMYKAISNYSVMQLDLIQPLQIDSVIHYSQRCEMKRDGNAWFITLPVEQVPGVTNEVMVYYHGKPVKAKMPPWDGGVVWSRDMNGDPWISVACQGMAAGAWFPNKDHMYDEVDGCSISITAPKDLITVSNGRLQKVVTNADGTASYTWKVVNPINNYNIIPYIGKYTNFSDTLLGADGVLKLDYWVLNSNLNKARTQFKQVKTMIKCFEYWFGKYPFYEDGYKLVEAPYLGMEHQSAIAYGNDYMQGYKGRDLSLTGWGLKWDFIIVHESGHEWFGNSISAKDVADNWIHESFTAYAENLYTEYLFGSKAGSEYVIGTRKSITNDKPIISDYNVNAGGSIDLYYKGANMLHTIRQIVGDDQLWRKMLFGMCRTFYHQTVDSKQIEDYMSQTLNIDLSKVFDQYLRTTKVPVFDYKLKGTKLQYRWSNVVAGFNMPVKIFVGGIPQLITPTEKWQTLKLAAPRWGVDENFYVNVRNVK